MSFKIKEKFGKNVELPNERFHQIVIKHPEVENQLEKIKQTLVSPELVKASVKDPNVHLYYKFFKGTPVTDKHLMVAIKILNSEAFIVTIYFTDRIKEGEIIWQS